MLTGSGLTYELSPPGVLLLDDDFGGVLLSPFPSCGGVTKEGVSSDTRVPNAKVRREGVGRDGVTPPTGVGSVGTGDGRGWRG